MTRNAQWIPASALRLLAVAAMALTLVTAPSTSAFPLAYVSKQYATTTAVIDLQNDALIAEFEVGQGAMAIATNAAGTVAFVSIGPRDEVAVVDTVSRSMVARIPVGDNPGGLALDVYETRLYVVNTGSRSVSVIDLGTGSVIDTIAMPHHPLSIAVHPDGERIYVAGDYPGNVVEVDTITGEVAASFAIGDSLGMVALHPSGDWLYVADAGNSELAFVDTAARSEIDRVPMLDTPFGVVVHPQGDLLYVTGLVGVDTVAVVDTATHEVVETVRLPGPARAQSAALTPDGEWLYVSVREPQSMLKVHARTFQIDAMVPVGSEPSSLGLSIPSGQPGAGLVDATSAAAREEPALGGASSEPAAGVGEVLTGPVTVEVDMALMPGAAISDDDDVVYVAHDCVFVLDFATGVSTALTGRPDAVDARRPICDEPAYSPVRHAAVSHDRTRFAFNVGEDFTGQVATRLFVVDLPSRRVFEILPEFSRIGAGGIGFSPQGDIYTAGVPLGDAADPRVAEASEVIRISANLDSWEQVTDLPNRGVADVSVSADGLKLAFNTLVLTTGNIEVMETNLDGSNPRVVLQSGALFLDSAHDPEHSPDNTRMVYSRMRLHMPDGGRCGPNWSHGGSQCHDLHIQPVAGGSATIISPVGATSIVADWKAAHIVYSFSIGDGVSPDSWIGNMLTDEGGHTLAPFGSYNLFVKWID